jgi:hypothetical protein
LKNKKPIFIVGFSRGGSSLLLNILRSHPGVCSPRGETQEVFKGKRVESAWTRIKKRLRYLPFVMQQRQDLFSDRNLSTRKPVTPAQAQKIDDIFYKEKVAASDITQNLYKFENKYYSDEEKRRSRLLCKNLNGLAFTTDIFQSIYPDAVFLCLMRNGYAVCEGHLRRSSSVEKVGRLYQIVGQQMISDAVRYKNYHIIKYEDLVLSPEKLVSKIYRLCELEQKRVGKFRLTVRKGQKAQGHAGGEATDLVWYERKEFFMRLSPDFNEKQIKALSSSNKREFLTYAKKVMQHFEYV